MSAEPNIATITHAPLTDAERLKEFMDAVVTLSALEGQSAAVRLRRLSALDSGDVALSDALASTEDEATEAEVTAMYVLVAQAKILFGNGIIERCLEHLTSEARG